MRATIESRTPRRSAGIASRSKPTPRSRTNTSTRSSSTSANRSTRSLPANFAAFVIASRAACTSASRRPVSGPSPTVTASIVTPCSSSTSAAARSSAPATLSCPDSPGRRSSQLRSSRSWRRARPATSRGSPARFWISASVCSTESCRCAASSARSCSRMRAERSSVRLCPSRTNHGTVSRPSIATMIATTPIASPRLRCTPTRCSSPADANDTSSTPSTSRGASILTAERSCPLSDTSPPPDGRSAAAIGRHTSASPHTPSTIGHSASP